MIEYNVFRGDEMKNKTKLYISISCTILFFILLLMVKTNTAHIIDDSIRNFFYDIRTDWLTPIVKVITYMGNWQCITLLCIILLLFPKTRKTYGIPVSCGAIFVSTFNKLVKKHVLRPRPDDIEHFVNIGGYSFPSGHSITSMFVYGMLIYLVRKNIKNRKHADIMTVILAIPAITIGLSRIYLGVHFPTDVLAGWCLGVITIMVITYFTESTSSRN